jgi:hypothetical protein
MYCPARWIRLKLDSIDRSFLQEASRRLFRKIRPSPFEYAAVNIHCAFGLKVFLLFRHLQTLMSLSKLQKLDPSAIDECAMVFVPPLACEKEEIEAFF